MFSVTVSLFTVLNFIVIILGVIELLITRPTFDEMHILILIINYDFVVSNYIIYYNKHHESGESCRNFS